MRRTNRKEFFFLGLILFNFLFTANAYAYLDPGSGSLILQMIVGLFLGALFTLKLWWAKVKRFAANIFSKGKESGENE